MKRKLLFLFALVFVLLSSANAQKKTIAFVEDPSNFSTLQDGVKNALTAANYDVTTISVADGIDFDVLNNFGVVIMSRTITSNAVAEAASWAQLDVPMLVMSPYVLGYDKLNFLGGIDNTYVGKSEDGTATTITQATPLVEDDVFQGVTSDGADFDFYTSFYNIPYYKVADFTAYDNSGIPMVAIKEGSALGGDGSVIMARWPANKETYPGSGTTPVAARSYIGIGADVWGGPYNYDNYTDQSKQLLLNEVSYLMSLSKNGNVSGGNSNATIAFIEDPNNFSTLQDGVKEALTAANYNVTIMSVDDGFDFDVLANYGVVIMSRTITSNAVTEAASWAELDVPMLVMSPYVLGYDKLNFLGGIDNTYVNKSEDGTATTITQATPLVEDDVFEGVTSNGADFDFYTSFYNIPYYKASDFTAYENSGIPMVAIKNGSVLGGDGAVIMARWPANTETYPGSGTTPAAVRSYIGIGADVWGGPYNYDNYTDQSKKLLVNEVGYLMSLSTETPTSVNHSLFSTEASVNVYPNPSIDGEIMLTLTEKTQKSAILKIHSITGRMVYTTDLGYEDNYTLNINLNKGIYLATIIQDGKKTSKKIIVQ
ncbi:T9SS type A sorting domain-containing protein [uncultured Sunxiuqinia sp.]|uniref:T9SS type A sorting domain-containing protein n=1 Tax=uncultured Sunxiuqinia sp. TaxID=1573825 RepID=UPI002AA6D26D|nr:T9SS type A sorting domain-containing protein [uncultured Sunxiuqinia sp.]